MCVYKKACTRHPRTAGGHFPLGLAKRNTRNTFDGGKCMLRKVSSKAAAATMASCCDVNASGIFDETLAQRSPRLSCHASRGTSVSEERESDRTVTNGFRSSRRRALIGLRTYYVCTLCKWIPIEGRSTEEKQLSKTKHIYGVFSIEMLVLLDVVRLSSVGFGLVKLHRMGLYHTSFHRNLAKSQRYTAPSIQRKRRRQNTGHPFNKGTRESVTEAVGEEGKEKLPSFTRTLFCVSQTSVLSPSEFRVSLEIRTKTAFLFLPPVAWAALRAVR